MKQARRALGRQLVRWGFALLGRPVSIKKYGPGELPEEKLKDLVVSIHLYVDWHYVTKQLTTEQKDLWADAIDEARRRQDEEEGYIGTLMAYQPVNRWWQE